MESKYNTEFPCPAIAYRLDWEDGDFYVGSTTKTLDERIKKHRVNSRCDPKKQPGKHLDKIRSLGVDSFTWTELGRKVVESRTKQDEYEEEFRELLQPTLNTNRAYLSPEQKKLDYKTWRENNREHLREYNKNYRKDPEHKEKASLISKAWHSDPENKEAILKHQATYKAQRQTEEGKAKIAAYNNKDEVKERNRKWRETQQLKNPELFKERTKRIDLNSLSKIVTYNGVEMTRRAMKNLKKREKRAASKV